MPLDPISVPNDFRDRAVLGIQDDPEDSSQVEAEETDDEEHDEETAETVEVECPASGASVGNGWIIKRTHLRPIPRLIKNQAPKTPIMLMPYCPRANEKLLSVERPACWKKYLQSRMLGCGH